MSMIDGDTLDFLWECSRYILEFEEKDFVNWVLNDEDPIEHIYAKAYIATHGYRSFRTKLKEIRSE